jgi:Ca2+-binding RTX toxin-like protein
MMLFPVFATTIPTDADDLLTVNGPDTVGGGLGDDSITVNDGSFDWDGPFKADIHSLVNGNKGNDTIFGSSTTSDTILGGQGDDSIMDGFGADVLNGNLGDDVIVNLQGGSPLMLGEGGSDTLIARASGATLSGGEGADLFSLELLPQGARTFTATITDWESQDRIAVLRYGTGDDYQEMTAADVAGATAAANAAIEAGSETVVVSVGDDLYAFFQTEPDAGADLVVRLVGRSLADISADNII